MDRLSSDNANDLNMIEGHTAWYSAQIYWAQALHVWVILCSLLCLNAVIQWTDWELVVVVVEVVAAAVAVVVALVALVALVAKFLA